MANKYVAIHSSGNNTEVEGLVTSAGAGDAGKIVATDAAGKIDLTLMPTGVGPDTKSITTSEAISAGHIVNIHDSSGAKARKADASSSGKFGIGFVLSGYGSAVAATVYFEGTITGLSSLTPGVTYFLSPSTPGGLTATVPTTAGHIVQKIGTAVSATELAFEPEDFTIRA